MDQPRTNVTVRQTERDGRPWFEVSAADQPARDRFGATMGRASTRAAAIEDFCDRTVKVMGGAREVDAYQIVVVS